MFSAVVSNHPVTMFGSFIGDTVPCIELLEHDQGAQTRIFSHSPFHLCFISFGHFAPT